MAEYIETNKAWDYNILCDWFINSIDETDPPWWTPEHIKELLDGFYVIPKRKEIAAPVIDAVPVVRCEKCIHHGGLTAMEKLEYGSNVVWCSNPHYGGIFVKNDAFCSYGDCKDGE